MRYADDFLLGFAGPKSEAEAIKQRLKTFLQEQLHLELSEEKTLITHAKTEMARFLGYDIVSQHCDTKHDRTGKRCVNRVLALRVPAAVVEERRARYTQDGRPIHRNDLVAEEDLTIVRRYQAEYRGYVQYYALAVNLHWFHRVHWVMQTSLLKTLARKHRTSIARMAKQYQTKVQTPQGPRKCLEVRVERNGKQPLMARFGGLTLRRQTGAVLKDSKPIEYRTERSDLVQRLLAGECEICGSTAAVEVHHVRKLADLHPKGRRAKPVWQRVMAARRRKTLILCRRCHEALHAGRPLGQRLTE